MAQPDEPRNWLTSLGWRVLSIIGDVVFLPYKASIACAPLRSRNPTFFFTLLALGFVLVTFFLPITALTACVTVLLYLYLRYEHLFNSSLVSSTPPLPENNLPSREEWVAKGGLKRLPPAEPDKRSDEECCIICRDVLTDPTQITLCGHVFCAECLDAWHAPEHGSHGSCPQCAIDLWRDIPADRSRLEKIIKLTAAQALVALPLTVFSVYLHFAHYILGNTAKITIFRVSLVIAHILMGTLVLVFVGYGLSFMLERRRADGIRWWGGDLDAGFDQAWRMAMTGFTVVMAWWLLLMSLTCEAFLGAFERTLDKRL